MGKPKTYACIDCDAEFRLAHNMDEEYYVVSACAFCGGELETEEEYYSDKEDE